LVSAPSSAARGLVADLLRLELAGGRLKEDGVAAWRHAFQALGESGPAGAAAIQEFLRRHQDYDLARIPGAEELGYPSLRLALFDCLQQIGGSEGEAVLVETLQMTADPREIALLAQYAETLEPGLHRETAVEAARQSLAMASSGQLTGVDMSPAFEVLQRYGDARVAEQLVAASQLWGYYGTLALAGLPEGAGLPALLELTAASAQGGAGRTAFAWSLLAQVASGNPEAERLLLEQARSQKIPDSAWPAVAEGLAGFRARFESGVFASDTSKVTLSADAKRYHITVGNQNFVSQPPARLSPDEIHQRTALLQQFLELNPSPVAVAALQQRVEWLGQRAGP
jgi:hypothetical protein